jgi:hypothetical protein
VDAERDHTGDAVFAERPGDDSAVDDAERPGDDSAIDDSAIDDAERDGSDDAITRFAAPKSTLETKGRPEAPLLFFTAAYD